MPNPSAFNYTSTTGTLDLPCYKATSCKAGYSATGKGAKYEWHGMNCNRETTWYLHEISESRTGTQAENSSSLECPANKIVTGTYHIGDENKDSALICSTFAAYYAEDGAGGKVSGVTITVENTYWTEWKGEKNSTFSAPTGYVIVGRAHSGDENGNTRYKVGKVYVSNGTTKKAVTLYGSKATLWCKQSKGCSNGVISPMGDYMLTKRKHDGDENGNTWTYHKRAKVDLYN